MKYRSKPSEVEAVQWTGDNLPDIYRFMQAAEQRRGGQVVRALDHEEGSHSLQLLAGQDGAQGWVVVPIGHWIVRQPGKHDDHWPVDPDYFAGKYEPVEVGR